MEAKSHFTFIINTKVEEDVLLTPFLMFGRLVPLLKGSINASNYLHSYRPPAFAKHETFLKHTILFIWYTWPARMKSSFLTSDLPGYAQLLIYHRPRLKTCPAVFSR